MTTLDNHRRPPMPQVSRVIVLKIFIASHFYNGRS